MDTRSKIIAIEEARAQQHQKPVCWLAGQFDPLLAEHVRRLRQYVNAGSLLIVEIRNSGNALLPQRARAELVAALSIVDYVVLGNGTGDATEIDADLGTQFLEHVEKRHRAQGAK